MIPYGRQDITQQDIDAVIDVLQSDWLTQGPSVPAFEKSLTEHCKARFAVVFNSATSALHSVCKALGITSNDAVWTSPNSFVASANCAIYCGASIDFVDINRSTLNMCEAKLEQKLEKTASTGGKLPKLVICVHFGGLPCDMMRLRGLADKYGFFLVEDASHAIGSVYEQTSTGSCAYSDATIFSFHPVKIVTTGEGGAVLLNSEKIYQELCLARSHGIRKQGIQSKTLDVPWGYEQVALGYNYRMTDISAVLGMSQLNRVSSYVAKRNQLASRYKQLFENVPLKFQEFDSKKSISAYHLFVVRFPSELRDQAFRYLRANNIGVQVHYIPIYWQPYYAGMGFCRGYCPEAEQYYSEAISLPCFPTMSDSDLESVHIAIDNFFKEVNR